MSKDKIVNGQEYITMHFDFNNDNKCIHEKDIVTISLYAEYTGVLKIDWGDDTIDIYYDDVIRHEYDKAVNKTAVVTITPSAELKLLNFEDCVASGALTKFESNVSTFTNLSYMFSHAYNLESVEFGSLPKCVTANGMFMYSNCKNVKIGDIPKCLDTSYMFAFMDYCEKIEIGDFGKSEDTSYMFAYANKLLELEVGDFNNATNTSAMFIELTSCKNLKVGEYKSSINDANMYLCVNTKES